MQKNNLKTKNMTQEEMLQTLNRAAKTIQLQRELIDVLYSQIVDLTMMSKIELGDDVIAEIQSLREKIKEHE